MHFNRLLLTKVYNVWAKIKHRGVMFDDIEDWCKIWTKTGFCFLKIFVYRLKTSNFILESKMAELTNLFWQLPGYPLFSWVGIDWWTLL